MLGFVLTVALLAICEDMPHRRGARGCQRGAAHIVLRRRECLKRVKMGF